MKTTFIEGTGVTGVALEFNLRDIIALQDTIVASLDKRAYYQQIIADFQEWKDTKVLTRVDSDDNTTEVPFEKLSWKEQRDTTDLYFREAYPEETKNFSGKVDVANFRSLIDNPFSQEQLDKLTTFLKKINTGTNCQATIFD